MEGLSSTYESLRAWILQLPGVTEVSHKLGGTEFQVNGAGFMHSHGPSRLDIRLSKEDQASALKASQAHAHHAPIHAQDGWVTVRIQKGQDLAKARSVVLLAYENAKKDSKPDSNQKGWEVRLYQKMNFTRLRCILGAFHACAILGSTLKTT